MTVKDLFEPRENVSKTLDEFVGVFRAGEVRRGKPIALAQYRVTVVDEDTAEEISKLFGGDVEENDSDRESFQVRTDASSVDVDLLSVDSGFKMFSGSEFIRSCNGETQTGGDHAGEPCPCASLTLQERKDSRGGCRPNVEVSFRLKAAPGLGIFKFRSSSWILLEAIQAVEAKVDNAEGEPVPGRLRIEQVVTRAGRSLTLPRVETR